MHKQHPHIIALILPALFLLVNPLRAGVVNIKDDQDFNQQILKGGPAALVEFSASWFNVCNNVKRSFEEIEQEQEFAHITFARVDIDSMRDLSKKHEVMGVPTFVYMENGSKKNQTIGVSNMDSFKDDVSCSVKEEVTLCHQHNHQ